MKGLQFAPKTARHARMLRRVNAMVASDPQLKEKMKTDGDKMVWVNSHVAALEDRNMSRQHEQLRSKMMPVKTGRHSYDTTRQHTAGNLFIFREFPMYPGEYIPSQHDTLSSLRDELRVDLCAQSVREAWMRVSKGYFFNSPDELYSRAESLDEVQLADIVAAMFPAMGQQESTAVVRRILETLSNKSSSSTSRQLNRTITSELVGLDNAPQHYTNFLDWMGRIMDLDSFKTEHAIFQFCRRKFNRQDVALMYENYIATSREALEKDKSDSYSHFYNIMKELGRKHERRDTRAQLGVRIDPQEADRHTGIAFGYGKYFNYEIYTKIRENRDGTGMVYLNGKSLGRHFADQSWMMEELLWPFDEANLNVREFDVYLESRNCPMTETNRMFAQACRYSVSFAIAKLLPMKRIPLKKAGLLSQDRSLPRPLHPKFADFRSKGRVFHKR